jgi:hypothetical protein
MRRIATWILLSTIFVIANMAQAQDAAKRLVGTWRLLDIKGGDDKMIPERGPHPTGLIYYDAAGNMAAQIQPDRARPKWVGRPPTPEEAKEALIGYTAYFGTYKVDEKASTVTHYRKGNIFAGAPEVVVRRYEFVSSDRVILRPVESKNVLTWERVKATD